MSSDNLQKLPDTNLLKLMSKDNQLAFSEVYDRYWSSMFHTAKGMLQNHEMAMDIVQDIMVNLWMRREQVADVKNLSAYLNKAVQFKTFQHLRNGNVAKHHLARIENIQFAHTTEDQLNLNELRQRLDASLNELPDKCRQVFELSRFEQLSYKEIAEKLGIAEGTVSNHVTRALKQLRGSVGEFIAIISCIYFL